MFVPAPQVPLPAPPAAGELMFEKCKDCIGNIVCHIGEDDELCRRFRALVEEELKSTNSKSMPCEHIFEVFTYNVKCTKCGCEYLTNVE
jgi:hypothetical protein